MNKKIVVFGSFVVDLTTRQAGLPTPGETVMGTSFSMGAGGKGSNQAVAAHRAGADVTLITKVGRDVFADVALDFYRVEGIDASRVMIDDEKETGIALILVDEKSAQNEIVVVPAACYNITEADIEKCRPVIESADILLLQLEINIDALEKIIDIARAAGVTIILNPAPAREISDAALAKIDYITPNETEARTLTGVEVADIESARAAARVFFAKGVKNVVITLGERGSFAANTQKSEIVEKIEVRAVDTTGAGDAFNGGFAMALARGANLFEATRWGNVCGAICVTRKGTAPAMPRREEIQEMFARVYAMWSDGR